MYNFISQDVLYFYLLVNNATKLNSNSLKKFFELTSVFDILTYSSVKNILASTFNISELKLLVLNEGNSKQYLNKINKILEIYLNERINKSSSYIIEKLSVVVNVMKKNSDIELAIYLRTIAQYLLDKLMEDNQNIAFKALFISLEEYFDLFIDAIDIRVNEEYINEKFNVYFELFHISPKTILFLNENQNIKIMQEFFPYDKYQHIINELNLKLNFNLSDKYFLIEADERLCSKTNQELLCHEIGHLLNLKVYDFQNQILNFLYSKNQNINTTILNYWLNEIIADILGSFLCDKKIFAEKFGILNNDISNYKYPPLLFRKSILLDEVYNCNLIKDISARQVALLIQDNLFHIKEMLQKIYI